MIKAFIDVVWTFVELLKYPAMAVIGLLAVFTLLDVCFYLYYMLVKKQKPIKGERHPQKKPSIFKRLLWDSPKRLALDQLSYDPETFPHQGIIIFEGRQGQGKTISMVEQCMRWQKEFPKVQVLSNLDYKHGHAHMESWDDLIDYQNPHGSSRGVIVMNDELQNTFNSKKSKDFPMEYVGIVTQNRKNRRVLLGTAQNFYMLSKDIRSQCTELRKCYTIAGCITIVRRYIPVCDSSGEVVKMLNRGGYFYVHSQELRDSYDTYEVIKGMRRSGFKPRSEQANAIADKRNELTLVAAE